MPTPASVGAATPLPTTHPALPADMIPVDEWPAAFRQRRDDLGLSQADVSGLAATVQSRYSVIEHGKTTCVPSTVLAVARALGFEVALVAASRVARDAGNVVSLHDRIAAAAGRSHAERLAILVGELLEGVGHALVALGAEEYSEAADTLEELAAEAASAGRVARLAAEAEAG